MKLVNILGISAFYHDSAACLVRTARSSPLPRRNASPAKNTTPPSPPCRSYCLREGSLARGTSICVAFYDKPFLKFERLLETYMAYAPVGLRSFLMAMPLWIRQKLWMRTRS